MRTILILLLIAFSGAASQDKLTSVDSLHWLAGCWEGSFRDGDFVITEVWMKPLGGTMLSMARTVVNGETKQIEFIRVQRAADGGIEYIADPSSQARATFRLIRHDNMRAVFENPEHDYPQRIIYTRISPDSLLGRIEGIVNGKERSSDFPYRKTACD